MILGRNVEQDQMTYHIHVQACQLCLSYIVLLMFSPFVIFDSDYPLISCLLCLSKTRWNIFINILCSVT